MPRFFGRLLAGTGALLIAVTAAQAQGTSNAPARPWKIGGALGATIPLGDFSDGADLDGISVACSSTSNRPFRSRGAAN